MYECIPIIAKEMYWVLEGKNICIIMENEGAINFLMQKLFRKPQRSIIHLDEIGSFVWQKIDGKTTVAEIAQDLKINFGERVMPVDKKLKKFLSLLKEYKFIKFK